MKLTRRSILVLSALLFPALSFIADAKPDSTEPMGQKFAEPKPAKTLRVLLAGSGSSHDFPKYFLTADAETLKAGGGVDVAATPNLAEALALLPQADVLVFSGNHDDWGKPEFQSLLNKIADSGKGLVFLHAAAWDHAKWGEYNSRFIGGATKSHGKGEFTVTIKEPGHPVMKGVPATFSITDESYRSEFEKTAKYKVLAENSHEGKTHASVWVMEDAKTKVVDITLGHAEEAHANPAFQTILKNAVNWVATR